MPTPSTDLTSRFNDIYGFLDDSTAGEKALSEGPHVPTGLKFCVLAPDIGSRKVGLDVAPTSFREKMLFPVLSQPCLRTQTRDDKT